MGGRRRLSPWVSALDSACYSAVASRLVPCGFERAAGEPSGSARVLGPAMCRRTRPSNKFPDLPCQGSNLLYSMMRCPRHLKSCAPRPWWICRRLSLSGVWQQLPVQSPPRLLRLPPSRRVLGMTSLQSCGRAPRPAGRFLRLACAAELSFGRARAAAPAAPHSGDALPHPRVAYSHFSRARMPCSSNRHIRVPRLMAPPRLLYRHPAAAQIQSSPSLALHASAPRQQRYSRP